MQEIYVSKNEKRSNVAGAYGASGVRMSFRERSSGSASSGWSSGGSFRERGSPRPRVTARVTKSNSERSTAREKLEKVTKVSVFGRIRRSFRRKKESYCISCGAVTKSCQHSAISRSDNYENVEFVNNKEDLLKWLDLDLSHGINNNSAAALKLQRRYEVK